MKKPRKADKIEIFLVKMVTELKSALTNLESGLRIYKGMKNVESQIEEKRNKRAKENKRASARNNRRPNKKPT